MDDSFHTTLSRSRRALFSFAAFIILLGLLELITRLLIHPPADPAHHLADSGWQSHFFASLFDWHEPDPELLWRFRPNLDNALIKTNSRGLIADETPYDKPPHTLRILILGDSSPVGLGLQSRTAAFPDILKRRLRTAASEGLRIELINAAVSGYSSEQITRFYSREGFRYQPDVVIVYCGNNDASVSGSLSDRELLDRQHAVTLRRTLNRSDLYRTLAALLAPYQRQQESASPPAPLVPRVSPSRFAENLQHLAQQCQSDSARLIVLVPPVPLVWPAGLQFRPLCHLTGESGELIFPATIREVIGRDLHYCISPADVAEYYSRLDKWTASVFASAPADSQPPEAAVSYWHAEAIDDPTPRNLNNLGVALWRLDLGPAADSAFAAALDALDYQSSGAPLSRQAAAAPFLYNRGMNRLAAPEATTPDAVSAASLLDSALQFDWFSLRIKRPYSAAIRSLSRQPGVTVIDLPHLFALQNKHLFIDHCHPTPQGHRLIADTLTAILSSALTASSTLRQKKL